MIQGTDQQEGHFSKLVDWSERQQRLQDLARGPKTSVQKQPTAQQLGLTEE